jgi:hypothetical protein
VDTPRLVPFQGRLADGDGAPLSGVHDLAFAIYDEATGGTALWREVHTKVPVIAGQVNVLLGSLTNLDDPDAHGNGDDAIRFDGTAKPKFLGIKIGGDSAQELVPSFHARLADTVVDRAITPRKLAPDAGVPVGGVILWWGSATGLPEGFEHLAQGVTGDQSAELLGLPHTHGLSGFDNRPEFLELYLIERASEDNAGSRPPVSAGEELP